MKTRGTPIFRKPPQKAFMNGESSIISISESSLCLDGDTASSWGDVNGLFMDKHGLRKTMLEYLGESRLVIKIHQANLAGEPPELTMNISFHGTLFGKNNIFKC